MIGRGLICLHLPIVCVLNVMFAMKFLGGEGLGIDDYAVGFICIVFCLNIMLTICCCSAEQEENVAEENDSKENTVLRKRRGSTCVIEMGF